MPRFVLLFHKTPPASSRSSHWDLMLEIGPALRTWALDEEPAIGKTVRAEPLPDHRLAYLHYEGEISDGRGSVRRIDHGEFRRLWQSDKELVAELQGQRLQCLCTARKVNQGWLVEFTERTPSDNDGRAP